MNDADREAHLARVGQRAAEREDRRRQLPCYEHAEAGRLLDAVEACEKAVARPNCWCRQEERESKWCEQWCAWRRVRAAHEQVAERLRRGHVEAREYDLIIADTPGRLDDWGRRVAVQPLDDRDAMRVVRAILAAMPVQLALSQGDPIPIRSDEAIVILAGDVGVGKTLAGCYAIGQVGGLYLRAADLIERTAPLQEASTANFLMLDDLGDEPRDTTGWGVSRVNLVLERRHGRKLRTIVTTNLFRRARSAKDGPQIAELYGKRLDDRLRDGLYVGLPGPSLRGRSRR